MEALCRDSLMQVAMKLGAGWFREAALQNGIEDRVYQLQILEAISQTHPELADALDGSSDSTALMDWDAFYAVVHPIRKAIYRLRNSTEYRLNGPARAAKLASNREYKHRNKTKMAEISRAWRAKNPERSREIKQQSLARVALSRSGEQV